MTATATQSVTGHLSPRREVIALEKMKWQCSLETA